MSAYLVLFHRTSEESAARIRATGQWESREAGRPVYFSTRAHGDASSGYGDAVVCVRVPEEWCELDDAFPDGEEHYRVPASRLTREHVIPYPAT